MSLAHFSEVCQLSAWSPLQHPTKTCPPARQLQAATRDGAGLAALRDGQNIILFPAVEKAPSKGHYSYHKPPPSASPACPQLHMPSCRRDPAMLTAPVEPHAQHSCTWHCRDSAGAHSLGQGQSPPEASTAERQHRAACTSGAGELLQNGWLVRRRKVSSHQASSLPPSHHLLRASKHGCQSRGARWRCKRSCKKVQREGYLVNPSIPQHVSSALLGPAVTTQFFSEIDA